MSVRFMQTSLGVFSQTRRSGFFRLGSIVSLIERCNTMAEGGIAKWSGLLFVKGT